MKIDQSKNQVAINDIKSQISDTEDLDKLDAFLDRYEVVDFSDSQQREAMDSCCGGDECCKNVTFNTTVTTQ